MPGSRWYARPVSVRSRLALAVAAGLGAMLLYAGQFVLSRWSIQRSVTLWDLAALRFGAAGLLLLPVVLRHGLASAAGVGWGRSVMLTITAGGPYTLILFAGLSLAPAGHGAVIIPGATPVVSTLLVWWWFGERASPGRLAGLVLVATGLVLVGWPGLAGGVGERTWLGDLLFVVAGMLWGFFTVLARRWQVDPLRATAMMWTLAAAAYLPVYLVVAGARLLAAPRGEVVFQAIYQGVGGGDRGAGTLLVGDPGAGCLVRVALHAAGPRAGDAAGGASARRDSDAAPAGRRPRGQWGNGAGGGRPTARSRPHRRRVEARRPASGRGRAARRAATPG